MPRTSRCLSQLCKLLVQHVICSTVHEDSCDGKSVLDSIRKELPQDSLYRRKSGLRANVGTSASAALPQSTASSSGTKGPAVNLEHRSTSVIDQPTVSDNHSLKLNLEKEPAFLLFDASDFSTIL